MQNGTPDAIMKVALGFMASKLLFVANEIGLFEKLANGPATLDELEDKTSVPQRTLRIVADAMVSLGFVERQENQYRNAEATAAFLSGPTGTGLRPLLRFWNRLSYPAWGGLEEAVRSGEKPAGLRNFSEEEQQIYSAGVEAFTGPTAAALATSYDFSPHRRLLDLGGGTGSFLIAVLRRYPGLAGTLFDIPNVGPVARRRLAREAEGSRIEIVEGNFFKDPLPEGHDLVIIASVMHLFVPARNVELLRRTRQHVPNGARLLLVDLWTDATHTQPPEAPLMAGEFLIHAGEGDVYSEEEAAHWLRQTGWQQIERKPLAGPISLIVAEASTF